MWVDGISVAWRWQEEEAVAPYHLDGGFFCEVFVEQDHYPVLRVESCAGLEGLWPSIVYIGVNEVTKQLG